MDLDLDNRYKYLKESIKKKRKNQEIWEIDISNDINIFAMDKKLKMDLTKALREYKLNQIIKK
jgi:hypothetical protein